MWLLLCLCVRTTLTTRRLPPTIPPTISFVQDVEAGDGTTSVVVLCGSMLTACEKLLRMGLHPTQISVRFKLFLAVEL
jgi:hypothetical protein